MEKKYMWVASSNDGCFDDKSANYFDTEEDAYNDMRNAVLEKMKWNTEYSEDFPDGDESVIGYEVSFTKHRIVHESYSGIYTYEIKEVVQIMDCTNGHNARLVGAINDVFALQEYHKNFLAILCAIGMRDAEELKRTTGLDYIHDLGWVDAHAHEILQYVCDDSDLQMIVKFVYG